MEVVHVHRLFHRLEAEVVGGSVGEPGLHSPAGKPHAETERIVIASSLAGPGAPAHLHHRSAAELGAADHQGVLEQAAQLEVLDHRGEGLVGVVRIDAVLLDVDMGVPRVALGVVHLHHPHPALHQTHGHEASARRAARAVHLQRRFALFADIEDVGSLGLHTVGHFHRVDGRVELRVLFLPGPPHAVELLQQVDFPPLLGKGEVLVVDEGDEFFRVEVLADDLVGTLDLVGDEGALVHGGQERAVPKGRAHRGGHFRAEHHETGKVAVAGAEAVGQPRAERGTPHLGVSGVHHGHRRLVIRDVGVKRANHAHVVDALAEMREQLTDLDAALAVLFERERRLHERAGLALRGHRTAGERLPVVLREHGLGIERIDLREAAIHEEEDDALGPRGMIEGAGREFAGLIEDATRLRDRFVHQAREGEHPETAAHPAQRVTPRPGSFQKIAHGPPQPTNRNSLELSRTFR